MFKKVILSLLLLPSLHAAWDAASYFSQGELTFRDDPLFKEMQEGLLFTLQNSWCTEEKLVLLMELVCLAKPKVCVEIGTFNGASFLPIAKALNYLDLNRRNSGIAIAIDAWSNQEASKNMTRDDPNRKWWASVQMEDAYQLFLVRLAEQQLNDYCVILRKTSREAASFIDEIDFLHLDGDYTEKGSLQDVELYLPKVNSGGYIVLSNIYQRVNRKHLKESSFALLSQSCELIATIDSGNAAVFKKR